MVDLSAEQIRLIREIITKFNETSTQPVDPAVDTKMARVDMLPDLLKVLTPLQKSNLDQIYKIGKLSRFAKEDMFFISEINKCLINRNGNVCMYVCM